MCVGEENYRDNWMWLSTNVIIFLNGDSIELLAETFDWSFRIFWTSWKFPNCLNLVLQLAEIFLWFLGNFIRFYTSLPIYTNCAQKIHRKLFSPCFEESNLSIRMSIDFKKIYQNYSWTVIHPKISCAISFLINFNSHHKKCTKIFPFPRQNN